MTVIPKELNEIQEESSGKPQRIARLFGLAKNGLMLLALLSIFSMCSRLGRLEQNRAPSLVQLADGSGLQVKPVDPSYRQPQTIVQFINEWAPLAFNWDNTVSGDQPDKGQSVAGTQIPSETWLSSFALTEDFRSGWLQYLIDNEKLAEYMRGGKTRVLVIEQVTTPKEIETGVYKVDVIANWLEFDPSDKTGRRFNWNKEITLVSVNQPVSVLKDNASEMEKALYTLLSKGLKISDIKSLT